MALAVLSAVLYAYQFLFIPLQWLLKGRSKHRIQNTKQTGNRYAVLICARDEEKVIGDLIKCIGEQTYDKDKLSVFVMADNCSDGTADTARRLGASVYERHDEKHVGKGYAMDVLMRHIKKDHPEGFDGYFVFDADNILTPDYIERMDRKAAEGYEIVTSYRNSKNFGDSWVSSGYAVMFMRSSRYLNHTRSLVGTSCYVAGTGYLFMRSVADEFEGWPFHMLTEDIEFSADQILKGRVIGFCEDAEFFDEQPTDYKTSWRQRLRWSRGYLQVLRRYGGMLLKRSVTKGYLQTPGPDRAKRYRASLRSTFSCYDLMMCILPAFLVTVFSLIINIVFSMIDLSLGASVGEAVFSVVKSIGIMYLPLFLVALVTVITEWKRIHTTAAKKVMSIFTSPVFMISYIPIACVSLFSKPVWKPISHSVTQDMLDGGREEEKLFS